VPDLRALHDRLARDLAGVPGGAALLAETDELVDAIDTLGESFGLFGDVVPGQEGRLD
jgi:hypothetical protein